MSRIRRLPQSVVNRIAAGEVVERPASVLRELLDNAIDAGARRIDVTLEQGGIALVRVVDDGGGMAADELPLAVSAHATSKLETADDLERIATLGFRGEALASIGEVARLVIRSRRPGAEAGCVLEVDGGGGGEVRPDGCAVGTTVEVHQLFGRVPARRAFLRSPSTEWSHASDTFVRAALAHPEIAFTLRHGSRRAHDLPSVERWKDRIEALFGRALAERLIPVEALDDVYRIEGFIGRPEADTASAKLQHVLVRGRPIRDRSLAHAIQEGYRGTLLSGRHPMAFLRLEMPADAVDVNVHPAKSEVRFRDPSRIYRLLLSAVRSSLLQSDLSTSLQPPRSRGDSLQTVPVAAHPPPPAFRPFDASEGRRPSLPSLFPSSSPAVDVGRDAISPFARAGDVASDPADAVEACSAGLVSESREGEFAVQMHDRYLVVQTAEGIEVIDQHALHERLLFEQLREAVAGGCLEVQRLLVPEPVELSAAEAALVFDHASSLAAAGVAVESFSGSTVLVCSKPAVAAEIPAEVMIGEIVDRLEASAGVSGEVLVEDVLHSLACRAAIKAGNRLSQAEVDALVRDRHRIPSEHCPHGRPTTLTLTRRELDRQFRRT
jgi:DNA mismatch repair protein MutL